MLQVCFVPLSPPPNSTNILAVRTWKIMVLTLTSEIRKLWSNHCYFYEQGSEGKAEGRGKERSRGQWSKTSEPLLWCQSIYPNQAYFESLKKDASGLRKPSEKSFFWRFTKSALTFLFFKVRSSDFQKFFIWSWNVHFRGLLWFWVLRASTHQFWYTRFFVFDFFELFLIFFGIIILS